MIAYIIRRILIAIPLLWGVLTLVFVGFHLIPGDPAEIMLFGRATAGDVARLRHELGLDLPLWQQYLDFLRNAVHLDFGRSVTTHDAVFDDIGVRFRYSLVLILCAMTLSIIFGLLWGILSATRNRTVFGTGITMAAVIGISLPEFWLGPMLALIFAVDLGWLPVAGVGDWRNVVLPSVTLAVGGASGLTRLVRAAMLDVLGRDYVRTARAKGVRRGRVLTKHALRNALIPVVTIIGLQMAGLLGGTVVVETVFSWPGLGSLAINSVSARDFPVIEGTTFVFAVALILANLIVDVSYAFLDPRIHYS